MLPVRNLANTRFVILSTVNCPPPTKPVQGRRFGDYCFKAWTEVDLVDSLTDKARFTGFGVNIDEVSRAVHRECISYCQKTFRDKKKWVCLEPSVAMLTQMNGKECKSELFFHLDGKTVKLV